MINSTTFFETIPPGPLDISSLMPIFRNERVGIRAGAWRRRSPERCRAGDTGQGDPIGYTGRRTSDGSEQRQETQVTGAPWRSPGNGRRRPAMHLDPFIVLGSAVVGLLVGLTGAGGGALMTPMLILLF